MCLCFGFGGAGGVGGVGGRLGPGSGSGRVVLCLGEFGFIV